MFYFASCFILVPLEERFVSQQSRKRSRNDSRHSTDRCLNSKRFYLSIFYDFGEREFPVKPNHDESIQLLEGGKMYRTVISFLAIRHMNVNTRDPDSFQF